MKSTVALPSVTLFVVCRRPADREHLRTLREWVSNEPYAHAMIRNIVSVPSVGDLGAVTLASGISGLALLVGFSAAEASMLAVGNPAFDRVFVIGAANGGTREPFVFDAGEFTFAIRKHLVRLRNGQYDVRQITTPDEFRRYFALRYDVWSAAGYIPPAKDAARTRLELDYTDRTAVSVGAFTADGGLAGCARLVQQLGMEEPSVVRVLEEIVKEAHDPVLANNFRYPPRLSHPFDILAAFPPFRAYYQRLVRENRAKGEVSRVIVHPDHQGHRLSEVLVDRLVEIAGERRLKVLFLACRPEIRHLYEASGFRVVPDIAAPRFEDIPIPSIIMERVL